MLATKALRHEEEASALSCGKEQLPLVPSCLCGKRITQLRVLVAEK